MSIYETDSDKYSSRISSLERELEIKSNRLIDVEDENLSLQTKLSEQKRLIQEAKRSIDANEEREQQLNLAALSVAEDKLSQMKTERDEWLSQLRATQVELGEANELCRYKNKYISTILYVIES